MDIDEKITQYKKWIEECELVRTTTAINSIRDAALRKAEDCKQMVEWLEDYKRLNSSEKANKWISVKEDMPIIGQDVLVCDLDGDMYITYLHTDGGWGFNYTGIRIRNVVAWQELPPSYMAESEEDNGKDGD